MNCVKSHFTLLYITQDVMFNAFQVVLSVGFDCFDASKLNHFLNNSLNPNFFVVSLLLFFGFCVISRTALEITGNWEGTHSKEPQAGT